MSYDKISPEFRSFVLNVSSSYESQFYHEVVPHTQLRDAMSVELQAMEVNHTWFVVPLHKYQHSIGCKWIYKIKHKVDGSVEMYIVFLVAKGYT